MLLLAGSVSLGPQVSKYVLRKRIAETCWAQSQNWDREFHGQAWLSKRKSILLRWCGVSFTPLRCWVLGRGLPATHSEPCSNLPGPLCCPRCERKIHQAFPHAQAWDPWGCLHFLWVVCGLCTVSREWVLLQPLCDHCYYRWISTTALRVNELVSAYLYFTHISVQRIKNLSRC